MIIGATRLFIKLSNSCIRDEAFFAETFLPPLFQIMPTLREHILEQGYTNLIHKVFKDFGDVVLQKYPSSTIWRENFETILRISSDYGFYCPSLKVRRIQSWYLLDFKIPIVYQFKSLFL